MHSSSESARNRTIPLTGVVLAGGLSSRLGHDKALIRLQNGEVADMLARTVALLWEVADNVVVIGRQQPGYTCLPDIDPGNGPMGGIATALASSPGSACLVLSCDLPFMEKSVLEHLAAKRDQRPSGTLVTAYQQEDTGHTEALVAIYEPESLPLFQHCVTNRLLKISCVIPKENQYLIPYSAENSLPFFNINYPADLEIARRMMQVMGKS